MSPVWLGAKLMPEISYHRFLLLPMVLEIKPRTLVQLSQQKHLSGFSFPRLSLLNRSFWCVCGSSVGRSSFLAVVQYWINFV